MRFRDKSKDEKTANQNILIAELLGSSSLTFYEVLYIFFNTPGDVDWMHHKDDALAQIKYWKDHIYLKKPIPSDEDNEPAYYDRTTDSEIQDQFRDIELYRFNRPAWQAKIDSINDALVRAGHKPLYSHRDT